MGKHWLAVVLLDHIFEEISVSSEAPVRDNKVVSTLASRLSPDEISIVVSSYPLGGQRAKTQAFRFALATTFEYLGISEASLSSFLYLTSF